MGQYTTGLPREATHQQDPKVQDIKFTIALLTQLKGIRYKNGWADELNDVGGVIENMIIIPAGESRSLQHIIIWGYKSEAMVSSDLFYKETRDRN